MVELHMEDDRNALTSKPHASIPTPPTHTNVNTNNFHTNYFPTNCFQSNKFIPSFDLPPVKMNIELNVELHMDDDRHASNSKSHASAPHHQPTPTIQDSGKHLEPKPTTNTNRPHQKTSAPHHQPAPRSRNQETLDMAVTFSTDPLSAYFFNELLLEQ